MSSIFLSTRDMPATGGRSAISLLKAVAFIELVLQVRRERRALGRLSGEQLADLGLDAGAARREAGRGLLDLPRHRVQELR